MSGNIQQTSAPAPVELLYRALLHLAEKARWLWVPRESRDVVSVLTIYAALFAIILYALHYGVPDSAEGPLFASVAGLQAKLSRIHHRVFGAYHSR